jgi:aminoglycoside phosphotransferase (APT) family kinase protein
VGLDVMHRPPIWGSSSVLARTRVRGGQDIAPRPLPGSVRSALGIRAARIVGGGGSPAQVWLAETAAGERLVVKALASGDGIVDGHDLGSFMLKPRQIRAVHAQLPLLSPSYVRLVGEWHGPGWAAYAMPFYQGEYVTAPLRGDDPDVPGFFRQLGTVFRTLTEFGYAAQDRAAPPGQFRSAHLDRLRRRLPVLRRYLDPELFGDDPIVINGRSCRTLPGLLSDLAEDDRLHRRLQPPRLCFPVHGDLNLGNLLVRPALSGSTFVVLDPRGVLQFWDPIYDFAKSLFSLTVFDRALAAGFALSTRPDRGGRWAEYRVALRDGQRGYLAAAVGFAPFLQQLPFVGEWASADPGWRHRLFFSHAVHCLAEAACRLSDRKPRTYDDARGWDACLVLARGLYLVGLVLLNDLLATPDEVEPSGHLGWLAADRPQSG